MIATMHYYVYAGGETRGHAIRIWLAYDAPRDLDR